MNVKLTKIALLALLTMLMSLAGGLAFAAKEVTMSPELAARREMVRKQQEQRITPEKRRAAVEWLKAERMKVYKAKQIVQQTTPNSIENNKPE